LIYTPFRIDQPDLTDFISGFVKASGGPELVDRVRVFDPRQEAWRPLPPRLQRFEGVSLVTPYAGGRLFEFSVADSKLRPCTRYLSLCLDSNMMGPVVSVLVRGSKHRNNLAVVAALARQRKHYQTDVQGASYLIEVILGRGLTAARSDAEQLMEGIFRLSAVDPDILEACGDISYEADRIAALQSQIGAETFHEMAEIEVAKMWERPFEVSGAYLVSYAAILKMILIGLEMKGASFEDKVNVFDDFLLDTLGALQPRLMLIGRLFFAGKLGSLLKANPGDANFNRRSVFGAAFDLYTTTTSEQMLSMEEARLAIIATNDHALADILQRFYFRAIALMKDGQIKIYQEWDEKWLDETIGEEAAATLRRDVNDRYSKALAQNRTEDREQIVAASRELEHELAVTPDEGQLKQLLTTD
jgi:hypothetical protein